MLPAEVAGFGYNRSMSRRVGDALGKVDDGVIFNSDLHIKKIGGRYDSQEAAAQEALALAAAPDADAVVMEEDGAFQVYAVDEFQRPSVEHSQAWIDPEPGA